jgi:hypothetical protein
MKEVAGQLKIMVKQKRKAKQSQALQPRERGRRAEDPTTK